MVNVPKGYRSRNVNDRRASGGARRGGADILGGMLGGGGGGSLLGTLARTALPMILGSVLRGRGRSGGGLGGLLGGMLGGGDAKADAMSDEERDAVDDDATLLLRAMINAAKADGQIDPEEIENITSRLGNNIDANEKAFLEEEFRAPLDIAGFCATVPDELNEEAYAFSVMGMRLDTQQEAQYLGAVAQGLRLDPATCNEIHNKLGVPPIFT